jgi:Lrp/AsnC family leucine-responsive transcriptional regulator
MRKFDLDKRDRLILQLLQADGRLTNADLAEKVNLSPSACLRRVKLLEEAGLIKGTVLLLDEVAAGLPGAAFVFVTLDQQGRQHLDRFETAVAQQTEILECYLLAGTADYLLRIAFADTADFERIHRNVVTALPGVSRVQSTLALRTVKKTTSLPI